jgi:hypothetical protein
VFNTESIILDFVDFFDNVCIIVAVLSSERRKKFLMKGIVMSDMTELFLKAREAFERAGGCVKRLTIDIGNGQKVTFVRDRAHIGILG